MVLPKSLGRHVGGVRKLIKVMRVQAPLARQDTGKAIWSQAAEIVALQRGVGKLEPDEYYQYRLYDDRRFTWDQKRQFLGRRLENGLIPILREGWWLGLANDKIVAYAFLRGLGFPIPTPYAVYHATRHCGEMIPVCRTPRALADFIRTLDVPFIAKPVYGMWGRHVSAVRRVDSSADAVVLTNGTSVAIDAFVRGLDAIRDRGGILLQELLAPHPAIRERCGDRICSLRIVTIMDRQGPRLLATVWKIATGVSMADNYWEPGNLVGPVDPATGVVGRTFTGLGRDIREIDRHPDTGLPLPGFTLPEWSRTVDLCLRATASIPKLPMQAWDVALTARGPVLLEVNVNGGMRLPQLCADAGLLRGEFAEWLSRFGYPRAAPSKNARRVEGHDAHQHQ
ncbi:MAG TPA: sugar-transfer associated ATP-grasp domain-containing protein [Vicinamibacterales bacterium]|nr:sugar-transfer associated ATP-grasp domain-containing protein [Vicinamibacterales bacterium]